MCNIPTKGYNYYSVGLKTVYFTGISWAPSFNKIRNILTDMGHGKYNKHRKFLRSQRHARFRGRSIIHEGLEVLQEHEKFCILTWQTFQNSNSGN